MTEITRFYTFYNYPKETHQFCGAAHQHRNPSKIFPCNSKSSSMCPPRSPGPPGSDCTDHSYLGHNWPLKEGREVGKKRAHSTFQPRTKSLQKMKMSSGICTGFMIKHKEASWLRVSCLGGKQRRWSGYLSAPKDYPNLRPCAKKS